MKTLTSIIDTGYRRQFLYYVSEAEHQNGDMYYSARFKLFFVTYWLIYWIHGPEKLIGMNSQTYLARELSR